MKTRVPPNGWTPRVISCAREWHKEVGWKLLCKENPLLDSSKSSSEIRAQRFISFHTQKTWAGWFPWLSNSSWFSAPLFRDQTTKKPHRTKLITVWNGINNMWHPPTFNKTTQSNIWNLHLKKNKATCVLKWGKITWGRGEGFCDFCPPETVVSGCGVTVSIVPAGDSDTVSRCPRGTGIRACLGTSVCPSQSQPHCPVQHSSGCLWIIWHLQ